MIFVLKDEPEYTVGVHYYDAYVIVAYWKQDAKSLEPSKAHEFLSVVRDACSVFRGDTSGLLCYVMVITAPGTLVDAIGTKERGDIMLENQGTLAAWACVIQDTGWRFSMIAQMIEGVATIIDYAVPCRPFGSYRDAADWFWVDYRIDSMELVRSIERLVGGRFGFG